MHKWLKEGENRKSRNLLTAPSCLAHYFLKYEQISRMECNRQKILCFVFAYIALNIFL